jgi:signal transduction histidine kinase
VLRNDAYYVPPSEYLSPQSAEVEVERALDHLVSADAIEQALRGAEVLFRTAIDQFPFAYCIYDPALRFTFINERGLLDSGRAREDVLGRTNEDLYPAEITRNYVPAMREAIRSKRPGHVEFRTPSAIGEQDIECFFIPVLDERGDLTMLLGAGYDNTERDRLLRDLEMHRAHLEEMVDARTADLQLANEQLALANASKNRFMANMSHDLRTPLNSVIGFSGIMLQGLVGELSPEQRRQLEMINASGRYLLELVNDTLDLERIEAGRLVLDDLVFGLAPFIGELVDQIRPSAEAKGLAFRVEAPARSLEVHGDESRIRQVLLNLLGNAVKFTETGAVALRVSCGKDGGLTFEVSDTGCGITSDALEQIFEEFVQLPADHVAKSAGVGLGLAICRHLATLMNGRLEVVSTPGEGSAFTFILPGACGRT